MIKPKIILTSFWRPYNIYLFLALLNIAKDVAVISFWPNPVENILLLKLISKIQSCKINFAARPMYDLQDIVILFWCLTGIKDNDTPSISRQSKPPEKYALVITLIQIKEISSLLGGRKRNLML